MDYGNCAVNAEESEPVFAELRDALKQPYVALHFVQTLAHGRAIQVKIKTRKVGPLIFPPKDGTLGDVLALLGSLADE